MQKLLSELFRLYYRDVYSYLYSMSRDASLSEDLASEVFLEAVKSVSSFRGDSSVKTWLFSIARHRWSAWLRKRSRTLRAGSLSELAPSDEPYTDDILLGEAERIADSVLERETDLTRDVFRLRMDGYAYHEIAQMLGISESSARVVYFRARQKIRKELEKEGYDG
ncbi:MAG: RNA polymerase sigma factor [Oscillospiraceae bacterium]|nr:RNA polymerase sigma factor [Oscillospiraceae bacterium]